MRIGFLFNHDQIHQVAHSLPIAIALKEMAPEVEVVLATTNSRTQAEVVRLAGGSLRRGLELVRLALTRRLSRVLAAIAHPFAPAAKLLIYGDNLAFFRSLDALVVAEKTSLLLKTRYKLSKLPLIHTRHGAGDRAIGFDQKSAQFDHVLVSGRKIYERLVTEAGVDPDRMTISGYPKFDLKVAPTVTLPRDDRPVVLYNPHVSPHRSSWYRMGRAVLDWFVAHDEFRLIFAPHVMLFERPFVLTIDRLRIDQAGRLDDRFLSAPNIHIDLGSSASSDMTYTDFANIYLGDASSQVYEFLKTPRPCVFLDAHETEWVDDPNYAHWQSGPVIDDPAMIGAAIALAQADPGGAFRAAQRTLFAETFDLAATPSSQRAAQAILRALARSSNGESHEDGKLA